MDSPVIFAHSHPHAEEGEEGEGEGEGSIMIEFPGIGTEHVKFPFAGETPSESFLKKFKQFMEGWEEHSLIFYFFNKKGKKILPQKWPFKELANTERGPIQLEASKGVPDGLQNWGGNQQYVPIKEYLPKNLEEAKMILKEAYQNGHCVTVIGGAYSWSNLGATRGVLINTKHLNKIELNYSEDGKEVVSATAESGAAILDVIQKLSDVNKILQTSPIFAKMSMGGGLAVGIHGTGRECHPLPDYVIAITVLNINAEGEVEVMTYNKQDHPDVMKALNVNLGAMGFVYSMTVQVFDRFNIKAVDEHVPWPATREDFITFVKDLVLENEYVELFWWPTTTKLWVKKWNKTTDPVTAGYKRKLNAILQYFEVYAGYPMVQFLSAFPHWTHVIMEMMMELSLPGGRSEVVAPANFIYNYLLAVPPKQWDMNQCLNIKKTEDAGYDFSAVVDTYLNIYDMVKEEASKGHYPLNTTLHTRFISNSDAYMSPVYGNDLSAMTEVLTWNVTSDWVPFFKKAEQMWLEKGGRPHWGKVIFQLPNRKVWGGGEGVQNFLKIKDKLDPHYVFFNDFQYDIFKRVIPKMMTVRIDHITMHESLFPRMVHTFKSFFHKDDHDYKIKVVTSSDARETKVVRSSSGGHIKIDQTFHNVTFSNFVAFQLWINDHIVSIAVWHAPLYRYSEGEPIVNTIHFQPNWYATRNLGCIKFELTPFNTSDIQPRDIVETIAIVGALENDSPDDAQALSSVQAEFVNLSAKAGLKVFVNSELSSIASENEDLKISVGSVEDVAKSSSIIVFACTPSDAQKFVHKCGSLVQKIVVDATKYFVSGADSADSVDFGENMGVAAIEEVEGPNGNQIEIHATNPGIQQAVSAWISSMQLTPHVIA